MKNTLYFNNKMEPVLLENEENELNTIFFEIETSAALNQQLQITVKGMNYSFDIPSSSTINFELEGSLWATAGDTAFRLSNDDLVSEWFYITFPAILSTDATLQEVDAQHYTLQGQESKEEELKMQILTYSNTRQYDITTLQKILEIKFASVLANTQGLFNLTINLQASGITDLATVTVRIRVNREFDQVFIPTQNLKNGYHVLTISYPVLNISQNDKNQIDIYIQCSGGQMTIPQGQLIGSLVASGIASSSKFTGEIEILDIVDKFDIVEPGFTGATDSIQISTQVPIKIEISETSAAFNLTEMGISDNLVDSVNIINNAVPIQRVLEDGSERVTEDGFYRYTEEEA